jgi:putative transposase
LGSKLKKRIHRTTKKRLVATKINQLWATDMTSFMLTNAEKLFLILVMDVFTRRIVGWHLNRRCRAKEWLIALSNAVSVEFPDGTRGENLTLRMDNGCQPTSKLYIDTLNTCGITGEWIGFNCPEQNAHIESLIGTLKQDWLWLEDCDSFNDALNLCKKAVFEYNSEHPHSSLGFWSPNEFTQLVRDGLVEIVDNCSINILTKVA